MAILASYINNYTLTISGTTDYTSELHTGRRIKADCGIDGYKYGTISGSSYSGSTTVVIYPDPGDNLTSNLTEIWYGIVSNTDGSLPNHDHLSDDGMGGLLTEASISNLDKYTKAEVNALVASASGITNHSLLDNLSYASSGHTGFQPAGDYATNTQLSTVSGALHDEITSISGGSGVSDHGALTGLSDDDHLQYHTDARGDIRYYTKSQITTISGNIVSQIPSLTGYATETWTNTNFIDNSEASTISGALDSKLNTHKSSSDHDSRYYTESEIDTISGTINNKLDTHKSSSDHDSRYYTESEVNTISGAINTDLTNHKSSSDHDGRYYTETEIQTNYLALSGGEMTGSLIVADHDIGSSAKVVGIAYGTGSPPDANTTPIGSLFFKYTA